MLECSVCGLQFVGSACTPLRVKFNNYKSCNRRIKGGASGGPQADPFPELCRKGPPGVP